MLLRLVTLWKRVTPQRLRGREARARALQPRSSCQTGAAEPGIQSARKAASAAGAVHAGWCEQRTPAAGMSGDTAARQHQKENRAMRIERVMNQPAVTCSTSDSLNTAAQLMWEHDCGMLPVVDASMRVAGVITDRDICMAAYTQGKALHEIPVSEAMAKQVFSCRPEDSVDAAEDLMGQKQIRRVPVVDGDGRPVGVLSLNDLARDVSRAREKDGVGRKLVQTLAAICQPRAHQMQSLRASARPTLRG